MMHTYAVRRSNTACFVGPGKHVHVAIEIDGHSVGELRMPPTAVDELIAILDLGADAVDEPAPLPT